MIFFKSLRQKILIVFAFCATITLLGFFAVYFLTLEQHRSLEKQVEIPSFSIYWFKLNNGILRSTWAQQSYLKTGEKKYINELQMVWDNEIHPAFDHLGELYKKSRVWTGVRSVERRAFYDLRLMILDLKNIQKYSFKIEQKNTEKFLLNWSKNEWPLIQKIIKQIELLVRWQTDFAKQRSSQLQKQSSWLGIWIWLIASIVLILVFIIALFFANRISAPIRKLRNEVNKVIFDHNFRSINSKLDNKVTKEDFSTNEDEVLKLTESFIKMETVIRERTELLQTSNRQLDESNKAKGMYLTNMSHELRTPLNAIIGFTEVLLKTAKEEETLSDYKRDRLNRILKSGRHLLELINSLLDLSKIEAGQMEVDKKEFQIKILLQDVMEWLEPLLIEKSIKYELIFETRDQFTIYSDSGKIRQILINLIGNAIKFTEPGGLIVIRSTKNEEGIFIAIKDNGCGISSEQQEKIFKVFHQIKSTSNSENKKGTGLGLALVQSLMELLGGSITLNSKIGEGSTFTIHFPSHI